MAVYRSDQAQFTFAPEAGHGGYQEAATNITADGSKVGRVNMADGLDAGSRHITVDNMGTPPVAGDYIRIGPEVAGSSTFTDEQECEVRRVEYVDGTTGLTLDAPTAFFHADNTDITAVTAVTEATTDKFISWVPGVYETVDTPDPEMAIEGRYLLGVGQKRNFLQAYKGQQTFSGSVGSFVLLNGWPLRFPIGKVNSIPVGGTITSRTDLEIAAKKGDYFIKVDDTTNMTVGSTITIDYNSSPTSTTNSEIRDVVSRSTTSSAGFLRLNYPLQFDHAVLTAGTQIRVVTGSPYYQHDIFETVDLDTMSWNVHMRDSAENASNDFNRRWFGGHCGSMSISADEGGLLTAGWDSVTFQDMVHNQKLHSVYESGSGSGLPGHALMQQISSSNIGVPAKDAASGLTSAHGGFPSTEPYYFSQGSLTIHGVEFARVRNFSLSVSNAEEPRYYINNQGKGTRRHRGPAEIRENQREYSMSASIALPDSTGAATSSRAIFKELILEGDYGTNTPGTANASDGMSGFAVTLTFTRATNDTITITIPNDGTAAEGAGQQGAFMRSAPHGITGDNPLQTDVDILFRNMKIQIKDSEPFYP